MAGTPPADPLRHQAHADLVVQRAAEQLRALLTEIAREIDPFPPFPGAMFAYGIEVNAPEGSPYGCVILGDDGQLYELQLGLDMEELARGGDHVATRHEELVKLDGLTPGDYVAYAYRAVTAAVSYLEGREAGGGGGT